MDLYCGKYEVDDERPSVCLLDLDLDLDLDLLKSVIHFETFHGIYIPELCWIYFLNASELLQNAK